MKNALIVVLLLFFVKASLAQRCDGPGQTPSKAFPVCGTSTFHQTTVPLCVTQDLKVPGCSNAAYQDRNPFWYRFTCYTAGTLGFLIKPLDSGDDYDWQLYDITGRDPNDVFTDASLIVTGNWAGTYGSTGASNSGVDFIQCASDPAAKKNSFSKMPALAEGHAYLLLVSHFTNSQSGYDLSFSGGTAVITDPVLPALQKIEAACNGSTMRVKLNKKIKCSSLANDGSDFFITPAGVTVTGAVGMGCADGFDSDSLLINLNTSLGPGTYQLGVKKGSDGNTLLDYCDNAVSASDAVSFTVLPLASTPMDSMAPVKCSPHQLTLIFKKPMICSSLAADGSDFSISGAYPVAISEVKGNCAGGVTKEIVIRFSQALQQKGDFILTLKKGTDGNTLLDECTQETPAGSSLRFSIKDTVNAGFAYQLRYGCLQDTVDYFHAGGNEVNSWKWKLGDNLTGSQKNVRGIYTEFDQKNIELIVSNGFCADSARQTVMLDNFLKADFNVAPDNCPNEPVKFTSLASGKIASHNWTFGDGGASTSGSPEHSFAEPARETAFPVQYTVKDILGCEKTITKQVKIYSSCTVFVPNAFTPGADGRNDIFRVLNAVKAEKFEFKIFNRWGQLIFQTKDWRQGWDGRYKNEWQPAGAFVWMMRYVDSRNNQPVERKGSFVLIR